MIEEEDKSLTKEKNINEKYKDKDKEINEEDPLNSFEIIQFESNRPKPSSKNKYRTIILFCVFIVLIAFITLYFLSQSDNIFNQDIKIFKLKLRQYQKDNEILQEKLKKKEEEKEDKKRKRKKKKEEEKEKQEKEKQEKEKLEKEKLEKEKLEKEKQEKEKLEKEKLEKEKKEKEEKEKKEKEEKEKAAKAQKQKVEIKQNEKFNITQKIENKSNNATKLIKNQKLLPTVHNVTIDLNKNKNQEKVNITQHNPNTMNNAISKNKTNLL